MMLTGPVEQKLVPIILYILLLLFFFPVSMGSERWADLPHWLFQRNVHKNWFRRQPIWKVHSCEYATSWKEFNLDCCSYMYEIDNDWFSHLLIRERCIEWSFDRMIHCIIKSSDFKIINFKSRLESTIWNLQTIYWQSNSVQGILCKKRFQKKKHCYFRFVLSCFQCAKQVIQAKIISSDKDLMGVVFYGTVSCLYFLLVFFLLCLHTPIFHS